MARRDLLLDYIQDIPEEIGVSAWPSNNLFDYIPDCRDDTPMAMLLWAEVFGCFRRARLTELEAAVMDVYLHGCSDAQIAEALNRYYGVERYTRHNISSIRQGATRKLARLPDIGVGTVLVETFGLKACRNSLSTRSLKDYNID